MKSSLLIKITAILMVAVTMFTLASCSLFGANEEEESTTELSSVVYRSAKPENTDEIVAYFNTAANNIKAMKPGVKVVRKANVRDIDSGEIGDAAALIKFAKAFSDKLSENETVTAWGDNLDDIIPLFGTSTVSAVTPADVVSASISTRNLLEDGSEPKDDNRFYYALSITLKDGDKNGPVSKFYDYTVNKETVLAEFQDYTDTLEVSDYDVSYNACTIYAEINKETDEIVYMSYTVNSIVTTTVDFLGELENLGETDIAFNYQQTFECKDFVWDEPTEATSEAE